MALPTLPLARFLATASSLKVSSSELNRVVSELWSSQGYWGCRVLILATELFVFFPNCPWNLARGERKHSPPRPVKRELCSIPDSASHLAHSLLITVTPLSPTPGRWDCQSILQVCSGT